MNHKNLDELRRMSVPELTELYLDKLFAGNPVNFSDFDGKGIAFSDGYRFSNFSDQPSNVVELKITDSNRDAIMAQAELDAKAYSAARNRNAQPSNLAGFDSQLVKSVKTWAASKNNKLKGTK